AAVSLLQRLVRDAAALGVSLAAADAERLCALLDELVRWNRTFNLTAIRSPAEMLTHHLLDSLAIHSDLVGERIADVGTGAGFPGLPLALIQPARRFTLIDSNGKKIRFVAHAARLLGLANVEALQARAEELSPEPRFDTVMARALAPLPELLNTVAGLAGPDTRVLAMKGKRPEKELAALPRAWRVMSVRPLLVPGLAEARCLVTLALAAAASAGQA
ncbi:MAG TPA: 16S rRNA (guanine(527)-N(7))-methyltransferase RsmG, partial [Steroidobacteraceae bacterium]